MASEETKAGSENRNAGVAVAPIVLDKGTPAAVILSETNRSCAIHRSSRGDSTVARGRLYPRAGGLVGGRVGGAGRVGR